MKKLSIAALILALVLPACSSGNSWPGGGDQARAAIDSCDKAKKFENAELESMVSRKYTGELNNYWGDDNTKLDFKHVFKDGLLVKTYYYYENGRIQEEYSFKCAALHGIQKWYYEDGTLAKTIPYSYGYRQGTGQIFGRNGRLIQQVRFDKDSMVGNVDLYDENGNPTSPDTLNNK
jgi:antitoxin component YwqK of YwqJK toxin-antitoxin module